MPVNINGSAHEILLHFIGQDKEEKNSALNCNYFLSQQSNHRFWVLKELSH